MAKSTFHARADNVYSPPIVAGVSSSSSPNRFHPIPIPRRRPSSPANRRRRSFFWGGGFASRYESRVVSLPSLPNFAFWGFLRSFWCGNGVGVRGSCWGHGFRGFFRVAGILVRIWFLVVLWVGWIWNFGVAMGFGTRSRLSAAIVCYFEWLVGFLRFVWEFHVAGVVKFMVKVILFGLGGGFEG